MSALRIELPEKVVDVLCTPRGEVLYRALYGGRGGGKSQGAARVAAAWGMAERLRILCVREFQASIPESFHAELKEAISQHPRLSAHYDVGRDYLRGRNGTEFIFRGIRRNEQSIKSLANIDLTIVEEAEDVPESSWLTLEATVFRRTKSELWALWNPRDEGSPVDKRFIQDPPESLRTAKINHSDNPFFPSALEALRKREQQRLDPATYAHVWEGDYLRNSDAQIFAGRFRVSEFEPGADWHGPYQGIDWGFSQDPTFATRCWIHNDRLWIEYEARKVGLELDHTADFIKASIPGFDRYATRCDNARPESISYVRNHGLPRAVACKKGKGSVEDGIEHMKSYAEIIVHPRCTEVAKEFRLYSYKVDRLSGDVLPVIVDAHNHGIDSIRYGLEPVMRNRKRRTAAVGAY